MGAEATAVVLKAAVTEGGTATCARFTTAPKCPRVMRAERRARIATGPMTHCAAAAPTPTVVKIVVVVVVVVMAVLDREALSQTGRSLPGGVRRDRACLPPQQAKILAVLPIAPRPPPPPPLPLVAAAAAAASAARLLARGRAASARSRFPTPWRGAPAKRAGRVGREKSSGLALLPFLAARVRYSARGYPRRRLGNVAGAPW